MTGPFYSFLKGCLNLILSLHSLQRSGVRLCAMFNYAGRTRSFRHLCAAPGIPAAMHRIETLDLQGPDRSKDRAQIVLNLIVSPPAEIECYRRIIDRDFTPKMKPDSRRREPAACPFSGHATPGAGFFE